MLSGDYSKQAFLWKVSLLLRENAHVASKRERKAIRATLTSVRSGRLLACGTNSQGSDKDDTKNKHFDSHRSRHKARRYHKLSVHVYKHRRRQGFTAPYDHLHQEPRLGEEILLQ